MGLQEVHKSSHKTLIVTGCAASFVGVVVKWLYRLDVQGLKGFYMKGVERRTERTINRCNIRLLSSLLVRDGFGGRMHSCAGLKPSQKPSRRSERKYRCYSMFLMIW